MCPSMAAREAGRPKYCQYEKDSFTRLFERRIQTGVQVQDLHIDLQPYYPRSLSVLTYRTSYWVLVCSGNTSYELRRQPTAV